MSCRFAVLLTRGACRGVRQRLPLEGSAVLLPSLSAPGGARMEKMPVLADDQQPPSLLSS